MITGRDAMRKVKNVTLENVIVGARRITGPEAGVLEVNGFVDGLRFR
jgi:hypothetical protein